MRVAIFYTKEHSGHHKAAEAIAEGFACFAPESEVMVKNASDFFDSRIGGGIEKAYMFTIKNLPWFWSWMYDNDMLKSRIKAIKRLNVFMDKRKLLRFIKDTSPDVVLCTQAVPCEMLCILKYRGVLEVPLIAVPTDFFVHSYWIHPEVDAYFVACDRSRRDLMKRRVLGDRINVTGIPVRPDFSQGIGKREARQRWGLDKEARTVLMMGGGKGLISYDKLIKSIVNSNHDLQILSVLGIAGERLEKMRSRVETDRVKVFGYVENVHELMDASDAIVSKPGGLTCAEVLAKGLPFIMTGALPGQEEENIHYMLSSGSAIYAQTPQEVAYWVQQVLNTDGATDYLTSRALAFGRPDAVRNIVENTLRRML